MSELISYYSNIRILTCHAIYQKHFQTHRLGLLNRSGIVNFCARSRARVVEALDYPRL